MSGLPAASQATLSLGANNLTIKANGPFVFSAAVKDGDQYSVSVYDSDRNCIVRNGSGTVRAGDVTSVEIDCKRGQPWATDRPVVTSSLSPDGRTLYIAGPFRRVGPPTGSFFPVDPITGAPRTIASPVFGGDVTAVQQDGNGGQYVAVTPRQVPPAGVERYTRLLRLDAEGRIDPAFDGYTHGHIHAMALRGNVLYVGGAFFSISGTVATGLAGLDARTGKATAFRANANGVFALSLVGNTLFVGGTFGTLGELTSPGIGAIDLESGRVIPFNLFEVPTDLSFNFPSVRALAYTNGTLFVGGDFFTLGSRRVNIAAIDLVSGAVKPFDAQAPEAAQIRTIVPDGAVVYVGGSFDSLGGAARTGLAALDGTTGQATPWNARVEGLVDSIVRVGGTLYLGGSGYTVNGVRRSGLAALRVDDGSLLPFAEGMLEAGSSTRLFLSEGGLWVAGGFTLYGGTLRGGMAALDTETGELTPWQPLSLYHRADSTGMYTTSGSVDKLQAVEGGVAIAGYFNEMSGASRVNLAFVDLVNGNVLPFDPAFSESTFITSFAVDASSLYIGGNFASFGGLLRSNLAAIDRSTLAIKPWAPAAGRVRALGFAGGKLFAGEGASDIAAYEPDRSAIPRWRRTLETESSDGSIGVEQFAATTSTVYARRTFRRSLSLGRETVALDADTGTTMTQWVYDLFRERQLVVCDDNLFGIYHQGADNGFQSFALQAVDKASGKRGAAVLTADGPIAEVECGRDMFYSVGDFAMVSTGGFPQPRQNISFRGR